MTPKPPIAPKQGPWIPGKPYRPSNGTEGEWFMADWCDRCTKDNYPEKPFCPIIGASLAFDIGNPNYPKEWIIGPDGWGMCTAYQKKECDNDPETAADAD